MFVDCFQHLKSGLACKNKWTSILGELKKIDYIYRTIHKLQGGLLVNTNKIPPPFPTTFTIKVENHPSNYNLFFPIANHKSWKIQVKNEIVVKSDNHVLAPQQWPLLTILVGIDSTIIINF
jgi:hypothetical protein